MKHLFLLIIFCTISCSSTQEIKTVSFSNESLSLFENKKNLVNERLRSYLNKNCTYSNKTISISLREVIIHEKDTVLQTLPINIKLFGFTKNNIENNESKLLEEFLSQKFHQNEFTEIRKIIFEEIGAIYKTKEFFHTISPITCTLMLINNKKEPIAFHLYLGHDENGLHAYDKNAQRTNEVSYYIEKN